MISEGSPPPMRGKARFTLVLCSACGITPAYAGKSVQCVHTQPVYGDHPRLCGEKARSNHFAPRNPGSPPPMRGKAACTAGSVHGKGITPAYAGKRIFCSDSDAANEDHPRLCGEKAILWKIRRTGRGSPPPMRGKELRHSRIHMVPGITPAYAGKSGSFPGC